MFCFSCYTEAYVLIDQLAYNKYFQQGVIDKRTMMKANDGYSAIHSAIDIGINTSRPAIDESGALGSRRKGR